MVEHLAAAFLSGWRRFRDPLGCQPLPVSRRLSQVGAGNGPSATSSPVKPSQSRLGVVAALVTVALFSSLAPSRAQNEASDGLAPILERGTLRAGTALLAPYAMRDASGVLIGHEIDIALAVGADLQVDVNIVPLGADELISALERGAIDIVVSALPITPAHARRASFSQPYARNAIQIIRSETGAKGDELADFNSPAVTLGVARGSAAERMAMSRLPNARFRLFDNEQAAKDALLENRIGLLVAGTPYPEVLIAQSPDRFSLALDEALGETAIAFAVQRSNGALLAYLNAWITARYLDGFLAKTRSYWFESTDWLPRLTEPPRIDRIDTPVR